MAKDTKPHVVQGGCLCGSVRYTITFPPDHDFASSVCAPPPPPPEQLPRDHECLTESIGVHLPVRAVPEKHRLPRIHGPHGAHFGRGIQL